MKEWLDIIIRSLILGLLLALVLLFIFPELGAKAFFSRYFPQQQTEVSHVSFANAVQKAAPTVVSIISGHKDPDTGADIIDQGSGVFIDENGHIVTNFHVIKNATEVEVFYLDGIGHKASVVGVDERTDLAVLSTDFKNTAFVKFEQAPELRVGDIVLAIGNPHGIGQSVTMGIVSGKGRVRGNIDGQSIAGSYEQFIQTDAAVNPGNSGGGLFDAEGNLVGINSAFFSKETNGISFALPVSLVEYISSRIMKDGKIVRGWLGVENGVPLTPSGAKRIGLLGVGGIEIRKITPDSPASKAGLKEGDIILRINGERIGEVDLFIQWLSRMEPGTDLVLDVLRIDAHGNRKELQIPVTLVEKKA
ncbi:MAG TPA: PDZ domain-containing protein [Aeromonadales bacterium]|nr:PDZ domain-containing protein [Aeromonadales bacterium]